ncbi:MAG: glycosyltransferase family 9 protein [Bacteroidota bacterium]|nr:glycosyltransferase family 9 protein [Bacteroidota bacterium]MDP4229580.1 glycosyltransferase family 9 protein [Bacteroidota bacterium]
MAIAYKRFRNPPKPNLGSIHKVLIIPHDPIGDMVLTLPMLKVLRLRNPALRIGIVASRRNKDVLQAEAVDAVYDFYSPGIVRIFREILRARQEGWDVVLATAGFYKPTRFAFISRVVAGVGITATMNSARQKRYARIYSYCFLRPAPTDNVPMVDQYLSLVENVFNIEVSPEERIPEFHISPEIRNQITAEIPSLLLQHKASKYAVVNMEAKVPYREWGIENVNQLAERLRANGENTLLFLIASRNFLEYYAGELAKVSASNVAVFETETIQHVAALISGAEFVISPDTAIVHIASALIKKMIVFYPAPDEWLPYDRTSIILYPERREPISTISVDTVFSHIQSLLRS